MNKNILDKGPCHQGEGVFQPLSVTVCDFNEDVKGSGQSALSHHIGCENPCRGANAETQARNITYKPTA